MQMKLCTKCKKRMAVVFISRMDGSQTTNEGYCLKCARSLNIPQIGDIMSKMGIAEEDLELMEDEMANMFGQIAPESEDDDDEVDSQTATFPLLNQLFGSHPMQQKSDLPAERPKKAEKEEKQEKQEKGKKKHKKHKFLDSYCMDLTGRAREGKLDSNTPTTCALSQTPHASKLLPLSLEKGGMAAENNLTLNETGRA